MSNEPRYPLALTLAQLNELVPLLDAAAERVGDPDAPVFVLQGLVRTARRAARSGELAGHLNDPQTLGRARVQVQAISAAKTLQTAHFWWALSGGYFMALQDEKLIDLATRQALDREALDAHSAWTESTVTHNE